MLLLVGPKKRGLNEPDYKASVCSHEVEKAFYKK